MIGITSATIEGRRRHILRKAESRAMKNDPTKLQMSPVSSWTESRLRWFLLLWIFWRVPDGSAAEAEARELRLGYFPNLTHAQALYVRASSKFESQIGVRVKWTAFNAGPTAIESLFTDAVDATFVGPGPTINGYLKSKGAKFVIVAGSACGGAGLV